jgi:hypothetical protein
LIRFPGLLPSYLLTFLSSARRPSLAAAKKVRGRRAKGGNSAGKNKKILLRLDTASH